MKVQINDEVMTPHGLGKVVEIEPLSKTERYGVELNSSPFNFSPVFYWPQRIKVLVSPTVEAA